MSPDRRLTRYVIAGITLLAVTPTAYAYLDPNSGGAIYQAFLPILLAVVGAWHWLRESLRKFIQWVKARI